MTEKREVTTSTAIDDINETLLGASPYFLAEIYQKVIGKEVTYNVKTEKFEIED